MSSQTIPAPEYTRTPGSLDLVDNRVPPRIRELLAEADGCAASGYLLGATACAQRAVDEILKPEKPDGAHDARVRALFSSHQSLPQFFATILLTLGDASTLAPAKLSTNKLQLLIATVKAVAHEIYVVDPERNERVQYVRQLLERGERKDGTASDAGASSAHPALAAVLAEIAKAV